MQSWVCLLSARKISHRYFGEDRMMKFDKFKIINKIAKRVVLYFTGFAEAFLNFHYTGMTEYAAGRGHSITLARR
jgi:hypothetical protein